MKTLTRIETYRATPEKVFQCIDDLGVTGMHMAKSSMPMMGGKLNLHFLTTNEKPKEWFNRLLSFFLADRYCIWCLKHMLGDAGKILDNAELKAERKLQHLKMET